MNVRYTCGGVFSVAIAVGFQEALVQPLNLVPYQDMEHYSQHIDENFGWIIMFPWLCAHRFLRSTQDCLQRSIYPRHYLAETKKVSDF